MNHRVDFRGQIFLILVVSFLLALTPTKRLRMKYSQGLSNEGSGSV